MASPESGLAIGRPPRVPNLKDRSAAALVAALMLIPVMLALPNASSSDPVPGVGVDLTRTLTWNFDDPANFSATDAEVSGGYGRLTWSTHSLADDSREDYQRGLTKNNIDLGAKPDSIVINVTKGQVYQLTIQPGVEGLDTYIREDAPNQNYGLLTTLNLDGEVGKSQRPLLWFNLSSIPTNADIVDAKFWLYLRSGRDQVVTYTAFALVHSWVEAQVSWEFYESGRKWTVAGGDFDAFPFSNGSMQNTIGWHGTDLSRLLDLWATKRQANFGLMLLPDPTGSDSVKTFVSSDDTSRPNERPKIVLNYTLRGEQGLYESSVLGPGTKTTFTTASWSNSSFSALTDEFQGASLSNRWSWTNDPSAGTGEWDLGVTVPGWLHVVGEGDRVLGGSTVGANYLHEDVTGPFEATTYLSTTFTMNSMGAGLLMLNDNSNWLAAVLMGTGSSAKVVVLATETGVTTTAAEAPWVNQTNAYIKIHFNGSTALVYYGSNGISWTGLIAYSFQKPFMTNIEVGLCVFSGSTSANPIASFDFLRVVPLFISQTTQVRIRLGNSTVPGDATWSAWSQVLTGPATLNRQASYVQYQVIMVGYREWASPSFDGFYCGHQQYSSFGVLETEDRSVSYLRRWLSIACTEQLNGGTVRYSYSTDHGNTWSNLVTGISNSISDTSPYMKLRVEISTTDQSRTPAVDSIVAQYSVAAQAFYVNAPASVNAGEPFSVTIEAKDENNITITHWVGQIALASMDETGTSPASGQLSEDMAWVGAGGAVVVNNLVHTVAETIRIRASAEGTYGLSAIISVLPGPAHHVNITPVLQTVLEYSDIEFTATVHDEYCNPLAGSGVVWTADAALGTLNSTVGNTITLQTGAGRQQGFLTATAGAVSHSIFLMVVPHMYPPEIVGAIEDQIKPEDYGTWSLDISSMVSDVENSLTDMRWYITNEWLVTVAGENRTGHMAINLTTKQDLFGSNVLHLVVVDSDGMTASTDFLVTITPVNDAPSIEHIAPLVVTHDIEYEFDFRHYVSDVDNPVDDLTLSVDRASAPYATVKWLVVGFNYPFALNGTQQFVTVRVSDGMYSSSTTLIVTVSSDRVPFSRALPGLVLDQGETVTGVLDLDDYFDDADDDVLFYSSHSDHLHITIHANHSVDITAPTDWWGIEYVIFAASDDDGARCEEAMTVTVRHVNQPPSIDHVPDLVVRYDLRYDFDLAPYITDADNSKDALYITANSTYIAVIGTIISLLFPQSLNGQTLSVLLTVSDGELSDSCTIAVTVSANRPPIAFDLPDHKFLEDGEVPYPVGESLDEMFTDPEGEVMTYYAFTRNKKINATAEMTWPGLLWYVWFDAEDNWNGVCSLTVRAIDPAGGIAERTIRLTVIPQPDPPQLMALEPINMQAGSQRMLDLAQYVFDPDSDDERFVFSATCEAPQFVEMWGSVLILSFTEEFLGAAKSRTVTIDISVMDEDGHFTEGSLTVTVTRASGSTVHNEQWFYVGMIVTGGIALGLFMVAFGMRRRPFVIRDMMLIHNDGFLIRRYASPQEGEIDEHILSSMLTAVLNFVDDSMAAGQNALKTFGFRDYHVIVERGERVFAAIAYEGDLPEGIDETMDGFLATVERIYKKKLQQWSGDIETDFAGVEMLIQSFVRDHSRIRKVGVGTIWKTRATDRTVRPKHVMIPSSEPVPGADVPGRSARLTKKLRIPWKGTGPRGPSELN